MDTVAESQSPFAAESVWPIEFGGWSKERIQTDDIIANVFFKFPYSYSINNNDNNNSEALLST